MVNEPAAKKNGRKKNINKKSLADLEAMSKDESLGGVAKAKAANELAQAKEEDPLPLAKAKLTQAAKTRVAEKVFYFVSFCFCFFCRNKKLKNGSKKITVPLVTTNRKKKTTAPFGC